VDDRPIDRGFAISGEMNIMIPQVIVMVVGKINEGSPGCRHAKFKESGLA